MNTKTLFVLFVAALLAACGAPVATPATTTPVPLPTQTPFPMTGCNAVMDAEGVLWFDDGHEGKPYQIAEDDPYVLQPEFFAYFRVECVQGYPRMVMAIGEVNCVDQQIQWEDDGGWSCWMPDGSWVFQAGGLYVWPRGKPEGYQDPLPIIPNIPLEPPQPAENEQHG